MQHFRWSPSATGLLSFGWTKMPPGSLFIDLHWLLAIFTERLSHLLCHKLYTLFLFFRFVQAHPFGRDGDNRQALTCPHFLQRSKDGNSCNALSWRLPMYLSDLKWSFKSDVQQAALYRAGLFDFNIIVVGIYLMWNNYLNYYRMICMEHCLRLLLFK